MTMMESDQFIELGPLIPDKFIERVGGDLLLANRLWFQQVVQKEAEIEPDNEERQRQAHMSEVDLGYYQIAAEHGRIVP